jgi:Delta14-sterol reductase
VVSGFLLSLLTARPLSRPGASFLVFGLPLILYAFTFLCNDISGCPAPSMLSPSTLKLSQLKREIGWPEQGITGFFDLSVFGWVAGYYLFSLVLYRILPAQEVVGSELASGGRLKYRFNGSFAPLLVPRTAQLLTVLQRSTRPWLP